MFDRISAAETVSLQHVQREISSTRQGWASLDPNKTIAYPPPMCVRRRYCDIRTNIFRASRDSMHGSKLASIAQNPNMKVEIPTHHQRWPSSRVCRIQDHNGTCDRAMFKWVEMHLKSAFGCQWRQGGRNHIICSVGYFHTGAWHGTSAGLVQKVPS